MCIAGAAQCTPGAPSVEVCDGADNNCDGVIDNVPPPAGALVLTVTTTTLSWSPDPGSIRYDLVRGDLAALRNTGGNFTISTNACLANNLHQMSFAYTVAPANGSAFWFLVRGITSGCGGGNGTYDTGAPSQVHPRDAGINASPAACP